MEAVKSREIRIALPPGLPHERCAGVEHAVTSLMSLWDIDDDRVSVVDVDVEDGPPAPAPEPR
ncbi:hypothetical protein [Saccharothrix sp. Mg75]|uniref:hypothetical protein n=1 Tax=Saccharothrix sp. Mg75 TaxID=3445357 RepID=UPI003EE87731